MHTLPGAPVPPQDVIGRDELIARLWEVLERQSLLLTAERRIGKTSIVRKMQAEARPGFITYFRDLESIKTTAEFADVVFQDVEGQLGTQHKLASKTRQLLQSLSGSEFQGVRLPDFAAPHWKGTLTRAIEDLVDNTTQLIVFFWDELPWMVDAIQKGQGEVAAMELLDTLRALRQTHPTRIRMVFTGSVGLHHVLGALKKEGYNNAPLNDLYPQDVPPLSAENGKLLARLLLQGEQIPVSAENGKLLARLLLQGEQIPVDDEDAVATAIATKVDNIAFYIHHVVDRLKMGAAPVSVQSVEAVVAAAISDPHDAWDLFHFQSRIRTYYGTQDRLALRLLDAVASSQPLAFDVLWNQMQSQSAIDAEDVRDLLRLLGRDHYLSRRGDGNYEFRYGLIRRYWRLERGL